MAASGFRKSAHRRAPARKSSRWPGASRARVWWKYRSVRRSGPSFTNLGGGVPAGYEFKAAQTGGPAGGCIPATHLDLPMDYDSLQSIGAMMGSGGLIVMDTSTCMVDVARFFMEFCRDESCGKCIPCRAGTVQMHDILARMTRGAGVEADFPIARRTLRAAARGESLRTGSGCTESGAQHAAAFSRRVSGTCAGASVSGGTL